MEVVVYGMELTEQQKRFADEYIKSGNATQAYLIAYPSVTKESTASSNASRTLRIAKVKAYIDSILSKENLNNILSQQEALELLKQMAFGEITEKQAVFVGEGVQELVDVPAPANVRLRAIESMLKRYDVAGRDGLLNRKLELEIQKLEQELTQEQTTEDKLSHLMESVDKLAGEKE